MWANRSSLLEIKMSIPARQLVICDGNSITDAEGNGTIAYTRYLAESVPTLRVVNAAVAGQTTPYLTERAPVYIDRLYEEDAIVIIWELSNDLIGNDNETTTLNHLITYCQARLAMGFRVIVGTCLPRSVPVSATFEGHRLGLNTTIRAQYTAWSNGLMDVGADAIIGATGASTNMTYYQDGVHLTSVGEAIVADYALAALNALYGS
jgi:hypothetical protein